MSEKKTIHINPDLFKVSSSRTRKKREPSENTPKIRVRGGKPNHNKTTKNQLLKYIRQQQENRLKKIMEQHAGANTHSSNLPKLSNTDIEDEFNSDFKDSLNYLQSIAEKNQTQNQFNKTFKSYDPGVGSLLYNGGVLNNVLDQNISVEDPGLFQNIADNTTVQLKPPTHPQYGCMKGGSLPTYREWRKTQKNYGSPQYGGDNYAHNIATNQPQIVHSPSNQQSIHSQNESMLGGHTDPATERQKKLLEKFRSPDWMKKKYEIQSMERKKEEIKEKMQKPKFMRRKQRKTTRRTFKVGKSKYYPRVSVLVSNRTIRKQIADKCQKLKQTPMEEVRKTLIKKGFIKVGSIAPNDVLRKMYESMSTVCGDVTNHNTDNLIYNYFNSKDQ
jgi:hypothetical protein